MKLVRNLANKVLQKLAPVRSRTIEASTRINAVNASNRAQQLIGQGQFGKVYAGNSGTVIKETDNLRNHIINEADLQDVGARLHVSPAVQAIETGPITAFGMTLPIEESPNPRVSGKIYMDDLRDNHIKYHDYIRQDPAKAQAIDLATHKQAAMLALNGVNIGDRHAGNIMVHRMTGRPVQIDYGISEKTQNPLQQAAALARHVANGFGSAGLNEEGHIYLATINGLIEKNDADGAMDVAKQGLALLQKIKAPVQTVPGYGENVLLNLDMLSVQNALNRKNLKAAGTDGQLNKSISWI